MQEFLQQLLVHQTLVYGIGHAQRVFLVDIIERGAHQDVLLEEHAHRNGQRDGQLLVDIRFQTTRRHSHQELLLGHLLVVGQFATDEIVFRGIHLATGIARQDFRIECHLCRFVDDLCSLLRQRFCGLWHLDGLSLGMEIHLRVKGHAETLVTIVHHLLHFYACRAKGELSCPFIRILMKQSCLRSSFWQFPTFETIGHKHLQRASAATHKRQQRLFPKIHLLAKPLQRLISLLDAKRQ